MSATDPGIVRLLRARGYDSLRIRGIGATDEVCTLSKTGTFNVSRLKRDITHERLRYRLIRAPLDETFAHHLSLRDIDKAHALTIPPDKLFEPGIAILCPPEPPAADEIFELIDGAHRAWQLHVLNAKGMMFRAVKLADVERYRVSYEGRRPRGEWEPITDADILAATWGEHPQWKD